tara:strand:- start:3669 stop:4085 length:417 start_codon:yes stop_codon:yes gene_type:complete
MTPAIENSIKEMIASGIASAQEQQVVALAEEYKFDVEEGRKVFKVKDIKFVKGRAVSPNKGKKVVDDTPKVKKAMTGYMMFSKEHRDDVTEKAKSALKEGEKYQASGTVKTLGAMWSALSKEKQIVWNDKAQAVKDEA